MTVSGTRVAVVGLGATGSMALWSLARRGITVTGFERNQPGGDGAAFGGGTRQFRLATHDRHHEQHIQLATKSLELWRKLEAHAGEQLYLQTGTLGIGPADDPEIRTLRANLASEGLRHEVLSASEVMQRFPAHILSEDEVGLLVRDAGVLRSNRAVQAAIGAAQDHGAEVVTGAPVSSISAATRGGVELVVGDQTCTFDHLIVTAGPWVSELVPQLRSVVTARAIVCGWYCSAQSSSIEPDSFPPGFRRSSRPGIGFTFLPALDGRAAKIIYWMPLRPEVGDTAIWDHAIDQSSLDGAHAAIRATLQDVEPDPAEVAVYLEGFTEDRFPVVSHPEPNMTVLCGFSGMGFAVAPAMGEIAADVALGEQPEYDLTALDPRRFVVGAAATPM